MDTMDTDSTSDVTIVVQPSLHATNPAFPDGANTTDSSSASMLDLQPDTVTDHLMDTDSDTTNPSPQPSADSVPSKNRVYYTDSELNSEPWTHVKARNKKTQKTTTNSNSDHPMHAASTDNSNSSSDTPFDEILHKLNHTDPTRPHL